MVLSADEEGVGDHAAGARDKIQIASEAALADMEKAGERFVWIRGPFFSKPP